MRQTFPESIWFSSQMHWDQQMCAYNEYYNNQPKHKIAKKKSTTRKTENKIKKKYNKFETRARTLSVCAHTFDPICKNNFVLSLWIPLRRQSWAIAETIISTTVEMSAKSDKCVICHSIQNAGSSRSLFQFQCVFQAKWNKQFVFTLQNLFHIDRKCAPSQWNSSQSKYGTRARGWQISQGYFPWIVIGRPMPCRIELVHEIEKKNHAHGIQNVTNSKTVIIFVHINEVIICLTLIKQEVEVAKKMNWTPIYRAARMQIQKHIHGLKLFCKNNFFSANTD